jgi:hypothetical protein
VKCAAKEEEGSDGKPEHWFRPTECTI